MGARSVGEVGEFELIAAVLARLKPGSGEGGDREAMPMPMPMFAPATVLVGPGDDAAVLGVPSGAVVVSTDVLVEDTHFRRAWCSGADVGHKAAAQTMADIAAMGARPTALLVGLVLPVDLSPDWVLDLADGIAAECAPLGARVVGGDITRGPVVVVAGTALGELSGGRAPILRSGARPGDVVAVCGRLGMAAAGLAILTRGFRSPRAAADAYRRPEVAYAAGLVAADVGAHAMIDVSDGLVADLGHVAVASGVDIDLDPRSFVLPQTLLDVGAALGTDPLEFVLAGGEDHALAATFAPSDAPAGWRVVGRVSPARNESSGSPGQVTVAGAPYAGVGGWDHFRR